MTLARRLGTSSFIYTTTGALQKGFLLLLLPVYTRYLSPNDYGIVAVITAMTSLLVILLMLSLHGAMTRFYFELRHDSQELKEFWGTVLVFVFLMTVGGGSLLLLVGKHLLKPMIGQIPFWPYAALGVGTAIFQPFWLILLALLQTREKVREFACLNLAQFFLNLGLVLALVVLLGWGATGPLTANLIAAAAFFLVALFVLRNEYTICIRLSHLKRALSYSLPLVPHSLASQITAITDRLFVNQMMGTASAGIYSVGFMLGGAMNLVSDGVNKAYVPISMDILQSGQEESLKSLRRMGLVLVTLYAALATLISFFSKEILQVLTSEAYHESYIVVPYIAFGFVLGGIYYLLVNILFFVTHATRYVALSTVIGAGSNILLNMILIPAQGMRGAAIASLLSQLVIVIFVALVGRFYEVVRWDYGRFAVVSLACLAASILMARVRLQDTFALVALKATVFLIMWFLVNFMMWRDPFYLTRRGRLLLRKLPALG